jgi:PAS domain S-box-containing protein
VTTRGQAASGVPKDPAPALLLHPGGDLPGWASLSRAAVVPVAIAASGIASEAEPALARALAGAGCVLLDAAAPDPLSVARIAHRLDPEVQVLIVADTESQRRSLGRAILFTPGIGELWLVSPGEVAGGIAERAAGVTRQRRKFRRTRERIARDRVESSPQRSTRALISDDYLANLLQVLPDPVFSVDAGGRILSANPAAGRVLRSDGASMVGASLEDVLGTSEVLVAGILAEASQPVSATVNFIRVDGTPGHGELMVVGIMGSEPALFAVTLHDLTERHQAQQQLEIQSHELEDANRLLQDQATELEAQAAELQQTVAELESRTHEAERVREALAESERQFRTLADAIPTLAWTARPDGYIDWYNARWYEYTGTTPQDMEGWGWQRVHHPEVLPKVMDEWQRSIATGAPFEMTFPLRGSAGRYRQFLTRVTPVVSAEGEVVRWFGINTDVELEHSARAAAEAARIEAERQRAAAEEANRAKSEFLSTMSHELRTPLNAIQGYAELLLGGVRGAMTSEQLDDLRRIRRANQHLMALITDVLNFARLDAGKVELRMEIVEIAPLVADVESLLAPQLQAKNITLDSTACAHDSGGRPPVARADAEKLRQVLLNLLTNAIKFTDPGGHVALACEIDGKVGVMQLSVTDSGRGIPEEQWERVFEPFVQVDRHRTHASQQGVGLGLAISRDLVRAMGGDIGLNSAVGVGSTFTITLPLGAER